jgi:hypothetical protein
MGLSEFHDSLPPVILHSSSNISNESLCIEVPLICCCQLSLLSLIDNRLNLCSLQGLVAVNLVDNFLNRLKGLEHEIRIVLKRYGLIGLG